MDTVINFIINENKSLRKELLKSNINLPVELTVFLNDINNVALSSNKPLDDYIILVQRLRYNFNMNEQIYVNNILDYMNELQSLK